MKTSATLLLAGFFGFFLTKATFEELAADPAKYIRSDGVFREGIAVCVDTDKHPARILATYRAPRASAKPKLILVKTRAETVRTAGIRPGIEFTAEGRIDGQPVNGEQQFWIEASSLERTGQARAYLTYPVSCDELLSEAKAGKRKVPWSLAAIAGTLAFGSGMMLGEILTNDPMSP